MHNAAAGPQAGALSRLRAKAVRLAYRAAWFGVRWQWRIFHPITLGVRILLIRDGEVLLVRHTYRPGWFLPGGGIKRRERLADAARREAREEAGATIGVLTLVGIYASFHGKSDHVALFAATEFEVTGEHDEEIAQVEWFPIEALPRDVAPGTRARIREYQSVNGPFTGDW